MYPVDDSEDVQTPTEKRININFKKSYPPFMTYVRFPPHIMIYRSL